ncbi:putative ribonuclease H-like domain-containing protein [Tanacetum coccineum]
MLADFKLPTTFWTEAVNTACYVQNRVLVVKPHNKTPYELFRGRTPALSFMRPFGCHVTILNTLDYLGKFDGKSDEGFFVGHSLTSKAFRVYNIRTRKVEENLHIRFLKNKPIVTGDGLKWLFDIDSVTKSMNYVPIVASTNSNDFAGSEKDGLMFDSSSKISSDDEPQPPSNAEKKDDEGVSKASRFSDQEQPESSTLNINTAGPSINTASANFKNGRSAILEATYADLFSDETEMDMSNLTTSYQTKGMTKNTNKHGFISVVYEGKTYEDLHTCLFACFLSQEEPKRIAKALSDPDWVEAMQEELLQFKLQNVWILVDLPKGKRVIGTNGCLKRLRSVVRKPNKLDLSYSGLDEFKKPEFKGYGPENSKQESNVVCEKESENSKENSDESLVEEQVTQDQRQVNAVRIRGVNAVRSSAYWVWRPTKSTGGKPQHDDKGLILHIKRGRDTKIPQSSGPPDKGSGPRCQDTILGDVNAQTRFEITSKQSIDPPLSRGYTLGSGEDSMKLIGIDGILLKLVLPVFVSAVKRMLILPVQVSAVEVNPVIYTSCIEQFWATAKVQTVNGVRQLQALVDKKRVIVIESSIRRDLHLDDAEGTDCLPTATIFEELARMGYEKPSQKLTFYKAFFSPQWKYFIHTITQCLSAKSTAWNEKVGMTRRVESSEDQESLGAPEDASKQGRSIEDIDANVDVSLVDETQERQDDDLMFDTGVLDDIKAAKPKVVTTAATTTTTTSPRKGVVERSMYKKDQIVLDEQIARDIQAKLDAELIEEQKLARKQEEEANITLIESWENKQLYGGLIDCWMETTQSKEEGGVKQMRKKQNYLWN